MDKCWFATMRAELMTCSWGIDKTEHKRWENTVHVAAVDVCNTLYATRQKTCRPRDCHLTSVQAVDDAAQLLVHR